ncbi:MAG: hypothetical protein A4E47_01311 [Methanosaeta sp. PtaU1.Bin028]|nr:MAG: hypothetical protein A4E47_01311 [Methanosaeta sp. PtaU1.Bin028]
MFNGNQDKGDLVITRIFDAPRELVWRAWTEPERSMLWWGPKGFTTPVFRIDLREGGEYLNCMRSPDGKDFWSKGVYREVVVPKRLVMTDSFADEKGNTVHASHYGMSKAFPLEMQIIVKFDELNGGTKLTLRHIGIPSGTDSEGARQGWNESFDKLEEYLQIEEPIASVKEVPTFEFPSDREVVITRIFDAPREMVFKASTDPDLIPNWWGPRDLITTVEKMDFRPGGAWRFVQRDKDGHIHAFNGIYREIVPPEREVHTFEFEGMPGHMIIEESTFEEFVGGTKLVIRELFQTAEDRDGMFNSGMKQGATESMNRLEELLKMKRPSQER